jgi:muramoyltetrapeptide carboxypeptidase LdcA involved in peptidoglycan recycling
LRGTEYWPNAQVWQDAILFLEPSEDAPSPDAVTWYLRTYAALGILEQLSGILYARPCRVDQADFGDYDEAILNVVAQEEGLTDLPIITHMDFGHTEPIFVLPYGVQAEIDCDQQHFSILESAVTG